MSYSSEVLADSPLFFGRMGETGVAIIASATASSNFSSEPPSSAIDGNANTYWTTNTGINTGWLRLQLRAPAPVATYYVRRRDDIPARNPKTWTFEGSNDGTSWTVLDTRTNITWPTAGETKTFNFTNVASYLYYRLNVTANSGDSYLSVAELSIPAAAMSAFADSSGNGRNGTYVESAGPGVAGLLTGDADTAASFTAGAATVPHAAWMSTAAWSIEAWFKPSTVSGNQTIASRYTPSGVNGVFHLRLDGSALNLYGFSGGLVTCTATGVTIVAGTRYHVVGTYDGTNLRIYVNGALKNTVAAPGLNTNTNPLTFGRSNGSGAWEYFGGTVDEGAYYGTSLSAARVLAHYNTGAGVAGPSTGTVAATTPVHTAAIAGTVTAPSSSGTVAATTPAHSAAIGGSHTSNDVVGEAHVLTPVHAAAVAGDYIPPAIVGTLAAATPAHTAAVAGEVAIVGAIAAEHAAHTAFVTDSALEVDGTLAATRAPHQAQVVGYVPVRQVEPWTADLSQRTVVPFNSTPTSATFVPPLQVAPPQIVERPIMRESVVVPDPNSLPSSAVRTDPETGQVVIRDDVYDAFPVTREVVGVPHIIIGGRDVTYFRDKTTQVRSDDAAEPFGDSTLVVEFPQIDSLDDPDDPQLAWLRTDATVHYVMQEWDEDGPTGQIRTLFHGFLISDDTGNTADAMRTVWSARGDLYAGAMFTNQPRVLTSPVDVGVQIPRAFNAITSRTFGKIATVTTGIPTVQRGNPGEKVMSYGQGLLADALTDDGNQWTLAKKPGTANQYAMRLKKTGVDWDVTNGQRGVELDLSTDRTQSPNVYWGRGQRSDGGVWMNKKFPDSGRTAPAYPFTNPGSVMGVGTTDAATSSGDGVSTWQRRAKALGFGVAVDGVFNSADAAVTRRLQSQYGIQVDGIVGPQTWAETFDVGALGADPDSWLRLPLAWLPGTMPLRYRANGTVIGPDPAYDPTMRVVSEDLDLGTDITLADGIRTAQQLIARENPIPLTGTITLAGADPRQGSRFSIEPGDRIRVTGYKGRNPVLHIADRGRGWDGKQPVTLHVAERPFDALTLAQKRQRDAASRADLARRPGKVRQRPVIDPWDCESNAGNIERHALYGGLWTVIRFPMSEVGRISTLVATTTGPAKFALMLFAKPVTSAQCIRWFGANPSSVDNPGEDYRDLLEEQYGWLEGWGGSNGMLGFHPKTDTGSNPVTGRAKESGIDYYSPDGYLYLAEWANVSCFMELQLRAAPPEA